MAEKSSKKPSSLKKLDLLVTGVILGGVVASLYGIRRDDDPEGIPEAPRRSWALRMLFGERDDSWHLKSDGIVRKVFRIVRSSKK